VPSRVYIVLALFASACTDDIRKLKLTEVDLANMAAVRELGDRLSPLERTALLTYAGIHAPSSGGFCGRRLEDRWGNEPQTVGDAIELTLMATAQPGARAGGRAVSTTSW
jgi:hypothetical protein